MQQQKNWSNIKEYQKTDYLEEEVFQELKQQVRQCWITLGMLHLRMENDVNLGVKKKLPRPEIEKRLARVNELLEEIRHSLNNGQLYLK